MDYMAEAYSDYYEYSDAINSTYKGKTRIVDGMPEKYGRRFLKLMVIKYTTKFIQSPTVDGTNKSYKWCKEEHKQHVWWYIDKPLVRIYSFS